MSAIYQNEIIELTPQDLQLLEQELDQSDDYQTLTVTDAFEPLDSNATKGFQSLEEDWMDELLQRWEEPTESQKEDMLWEESYRLDSDIEELDNNSFL